MLITPRPRQIKIQITEYGTSRRKNLGQTMTEKSHTKKRGTSHKFICSVCLNTRVNSDKFDVGYKTRSCPVCEKPSHAIEPNPRSSIRDIKTNDEERDKQTNKEDSKLSSKEDEISVGLNLLNEVLNVFQHNKKLEVNKPKSTNLKDAAVGPDSKSDNNKLKLGISKTFQLSIGEENYCKDFGRSSFSVVNAVSPENFRRSPVAFLKHKSSSIPQMKLEELKNSFKQHTKSKDAIEEVNRMFATVKKTDTSDQHNRPMIRNGPRVLPVVKTTLYKKTEELHRSNEFNECEERKHLCDQCNSALDYHLSSGDSRKGTDKCCQMQARKQKESYSHCVHRRKLQNLVVCECCQNSYDVQEVCCNNIDIQNK